MSADWRDGSSSCSSAMTFGSIKEASIVSRADILSRGPEVCSAVSVPKCRWYQRILTRIKNRLIDFPDYRVERNWLYRHILHDLDFREIDPSEQWKMYIPRRESDRIGETTQRPLPDTWG